jgi:hypothetical protein
VIVDHWIRANHTTRVPRRWVCLDTEADQHDVPGGTAQTWRLGVTSFDRCDTDDHHWIGTQWQTHTDPGELWRYIDAKTRRRARTVVIAHNLGYDLRISRALDHLPALGWSIHRFSVHDRSVSLTLRRDGRSLILADSMAWLPMSLERVGGLVGAAKTPLPGWDADASEWEQRCRRDVEILRAAVLDLVRWVESGDLGNWQKTGAGQAWSHWRHAHYTHRVLVHSDDEARAAEVASMASARCEAWRHGTLRGEWWEEWDLPLAYPAAALDLDLPVALHAMRHDPPWSWVVKAAGVRRALIEASVTTDTPTLPVVAEGRTLWPVGTFTGTWWDTELLLAKDHGATITPTRAWSYRRAPALASWAAWIIAAATDPTVTGSHVRMAAAKHMARALIGKFAVRWTPWEEWGEMPFDADPFEQVYDAENDRTGRVLTLGSQSWVGWQRRYGADALPAITSAVMAEVRIRLWSLMNTAGLANVAYVDTDSLIVNRTGAAALRELVDAGGGWGVRLKQRHRRLTVLGPRQLITDEATRIAGVPKAATWATGATMRGELWESVEAAIKNGRTGEVVIRPATWRIQGTDRRRVHLGGGRTGAVELGSVEGVEVAV